MLQTFCEMKGLKEINVLEKGMDFRRPELRKEVFARFFEFHTSYGIHPGLVYLFLPEMADQENWCLEQRFWAAFLEGCCENPCTVWQITREFPELPKDLNLFEKWHSENWRSLAYDTDTRYNKGCLIDQLKSYLENLAGRTQQEFFMDFLHDNNPKKWFDNVWEAVNEFYKFGRLTSWSYIEFIKILTEAKYEWSNFMMTNVLGSKSHRNGCLRVMGRDDLEWWEKSGNGVKTHSVDFCKEVEEYGDHLTHYLKERFNDKPWSKDIGYQTVESALCAFKNCFHGHRYPNIYTDMSYDRIKKAETLTNGKIDFSIFWKLREEKLPAKLLLEKNPLDPGLKPEKQEFFMKTGSLPMMSVLDEVFESEWDTRYYGPEENAFFV